MAGFLGAAIKTKPGGTKHLTQPGLIKRTLKLMQLDQGNGKATPAEHGAFQKDGQGKQFQETWNCQSAMGMMMCLATNTRPEIALAVNQCARCSKDHSWESNEMHSSTSNKCLNRE